jgi:hypothetical protein
MSEQKSKSPVTINDHLQQYWNLNNQMNDYRSRVLQPMIKTVGRLLGHIPENKPAWLKSTDEAWSARFDEEGLLCVFGIDGKGGEIRFTIPHSVLCAEFPEEAAKEYSTKVTIQKQEARIRELERQVQELTSSHRGGNWSIGG